MCMCVREKERETGRGGRAKERERETARTHATETVREEEKTKVRQREAEGQKETIILICVGDAFLLIRYPVVIRVEVPEVWYPVFIAVHCAFNGIIDQIVVAVYVEKVGSSVTVRVNTSLQRVGQRIAVTAE